MDLEYGPEYLEFTSEVSAFCKQYRGLSFKDGPKTPFATSGDSGGPSMLRTEWQKY